jgi:hypothetical protein
MRTGFMPSKPILPNGIPHGNAGRALNTGQNQFGRRVLAFQQRFGYLWVRAFVNPRGADTSFGARVGIC